MQHDAQLVPISSLKPYPGNARTHDLDLIRESLRVNGQYRPVVVRSKTRHVLAGNGTLEAAKVEGMEEIWATFIDVDAKTARRINVVDNRANDRAGWDEQALAVQLGEMPDLEGSGWSEKELVQFMARISSGEPDAEPQDIPETFDVLVRCGSEEAQVALLERLSAEGLECQALLS